MSFHLWADIQRLSDLGCFVIWELKSTRIRKVSTFMVYYKELYAIINLKTLYYGFYFKYRHVSGKHKVKYVHRIKSRGITNFIHSRIFCLGISSLVVVERLLSMHRWHIPRKVIRSRGATRNKSGPGCGDSLASWGRNSRRGLRCLARRVKRPRTLRRRRVRGEVAGYAFADPAVTDLASSAVGSWPPVPQPGIRRPSPR